MNSAPAKLILASGSTRRVALLEQIGITPDLLIPSALDEAPGKREMPRTLVKRLARAKAHKASQSHLMKVLDEPAYIIAADTIVALGRRIINKPESIDEAHANLKKLSGRNHRVFTGVCVITPEGAYRQRIVETRVRFKRLSAQDLENYIASGEWRDKAGGYAIQGFAGAFVQKIIGSYSNVVGLPLYETVLLLQGAGFPVYHSWSSGI